MTEQQWDQLDAERGAAPAEPQGDLFDATVPVVADAKPVPKKSKPKPAPKDDGEWIGKVKDDWL